MALISEEYRRLNAELHERNPEYGTTAHSWVGNVRDLARMSGCDSILDYGCGKGQLRKLLPEYDVREYDPAIEAHAADPEPADLLVSIDVMEHIEPECLDEVLEHMRSKTLSNAFITVSLIPAQKTLKDGRNAHILLRPYTWWISYLTQYWELGGCSIIRMKPAGEDKKVPGVLIFAGRAV